MKDRMFVSIVIVLSVLAGLITTVLVLTYEEEDLPPPKPPPWCPLRVVSSTEVHIGLPHILPRPRPTDLKVILIRNESHSGYYEFQTDDDGPLSLERGIDTGTVHYVDLVDNQLVNECDELRLTELNPDSNYELCLFWAHTGDEIWRKVFSTPP